VLNFVVFGAGKGELPRTGCQPIADVFELSPNQCIFLQFAVYYAIVYFNSYFTLNMSNSSRLIVYLSFISLLLLFCSLPQRVLNSIVPQAATTETIPRQPESTPNISLKVESTSPVFATPANPTQLIQPQDFVYLGAFRLPEPSGGSNWEYSGYGMTYYPDGDPDGVNDGYPGSLFAIGHDQQQLVSEISIPTPILSANKDLEQLNSASTLQPFQDITAGMFGYLEVPRADLEYLPPQGEQTSPRLYFCWGQHFEFENNPTHGWSNLNLANPQPAGAWHLADYTNYVTNDYLFEIPESWANDYAPGLRLATGRFRDGTWGGLGPALLAVAPWTEGNPPPAGATLKNVKPLLMYGISVPGSPELSISDEMKMISFGEADEWSGGAWFTAGDKSAVILVGTKALGRNWYGFANGVEYPTSGDPNEAIPDVPPWPYEQRGWWSEGIESQILFYNPDDLGAAASGIIETWQPQPYATLSLDPYLFDPGFDLERDKRYLVGALAFDRVNGILYVVERRADGDKSLVHVFRVQ
jgi:hypothetical protein